MWYLSWFLGVGLASLFAAACGIGLELGDSGKDGSSGR